MDRAEILRYMRTNSRVDGDRILSLVDTAVDMIEKNVAPRTIYRVFDCTVGDDGVAIGDCFFASRRLAENMVGCNRVVVFGATLGTECDRIIRLTSATDMALAMALQATAASRIEEVCDNLERSIIAEYGFTLRKRFSPGYYDLDITEQKKVFELIDITKMIGVTLTDTCEMVPVKSVTAFIGVE